MYLGKERGWVGVCMPPKGKKTSHRDNVHEFGDRGGSARANCRQYADLEIALVHSNQTTGKPSANQVVEGVLHLSKFGLPHRDGMARVASQKNV